tara:strand:+ start:184 stop:672 length:489 start_codon:yes stop_codon:yes gene_type:complete
MILEEIDDEDDLEFAEQFYIKLYRDLHGDKLLNKMTPLQTNKEYRHHNKVELAAYYQANKDKIAEYHKDYRQHNKVELAEYQKDYQQHNKVELAEKKKDYQQHNKDKISEKKKEYRQHNKDKIAEWYKKKITCECDAIITQSKIARHNRTAKHKNFLISKDN